MRITNKAQMSLVMLFVVAIAFILYAVSINWTRVAAIKTQVTIASNTGAASLASTMASYARSVKEDQLGGRFRKCEHTSLFTYILTAFLLVIVLVAAIFTVGAAGATVGVIITGVAIAAGVGIAASTIAAVVQATSVEPGMMKAWRLWQKKLELADQFLESGVQGMLQSASSDMVKVPDRWDMDMDGKFYDGADGNSTDKLARFSYFYSMRMRIETPAASVAGVSRLQDMMKGITSDLGIYDSGISGYGAGIPTFANRIKGAIGYDDYRAENAANLTFFRAEQAQSGSFFNFLWRMKYITPTLGFATGTAPAMTSNTCFWYAGTCTGSGYYYWGGLTKTHLASSWSEPQTSGFPAGERITGSACVGNDCWVNWVKFSGTGNYQKLDMVPGIFTSVEVTENHSTCPSMEGTESWVYSGVSHTSGPTVPAAPWWRPGTDWSTPEADRYTFNDNGTDYPMRYMSDTFNVVDPKCGNDTEDPDCKCSTTHKKQWWRDDWIDKIQLQMETLRVMSEPLLQATTEAQQRGMQATVETWGPILQKTLRAMYQPSDIEAGGIVIRSNSLYGMLDRHWYPLLNAWLFPVYDNGNATTNTDYAHDNIFCLPRRIADVPSDESSFILSGGVQWGTFASVTKCLQYHEGDYAKFRDCYVDGFDGSLDTTSCNNLPRSLHIGFTPYDDTIYQGWYDTNKEHLRQSAILARNLSLKAQQRRTYLQSMQTQAAALRTKFNHARRWLSLPCNSSSAATYFPWIYYSSAENPAYPCLPEDVNSGTIWYAKTPVENAIELIERLMVEQEMEKLSPGNDVIYGWFSEPPEQGSAPHTIDGQPAGYLHLVRVQAVLPTRRNIPGLPVAVDSDERVPWVNVYTTGPWYDEEMCYELDDYWGNVGTRVIRYDEEHHGSLSFLNGLPLWNISYRNPYQTALTSTDINNVISQCFGHHWMTTHVGGAEPFQFDPDPIANQTVLSNGVSNKLKQAFMLNIPYKPEQFTNESALDPCLRAAEKLLARGVVSQTCAKFDASTSPATIKFMECP